MDSSDLSLKKKEALSISKYDNTHLKNTFNFEIHYGEGPSNISGTSNIVGNIREFIAYDDVKYRFVFFDNSGKFKYEIKSPKTLSSAFSNGVYFPKNQSMVMGLRGSDFNKIAINLYAFQLKKTSQSKMIYQHAILNQYYSDKKLCVATPIDFCSLNDKLYVLDMIDYKITKISSSTWKIEKEIKIRFENKSFDKAQLSKWYTGHYGKERPNRLYYQNLMPACWIFPLKEYLLVGRRENYAPDKSDFIRVDVFNRDLQYIGQSKIPYFKFWNEPMLGALYCHLHNYYNNGSLFQLFEKEINDESKYFLLKWTLK